MKIAGCEVFLKRDGGTRCREIMSNRDATLLRTVAQIASWLFPHAQIHGLNSEAPPFFSMEVSSHDGRRWNDRAHHEVTLSGATPTDCRTLAARSNRGFPRSRRLHGFRPVAQFPNRIGQHRIRCIDRHIPAIPYATQAGDEGFGVAGITISND